MVNPKDIAGERKKKQQQQQQPPPPKKKKKKNILNSESLKIGLKIHQGTTKYMTNHADSEDILTDRQKKTKK